MTMSNRIGVREELVTIPNLIVSDLRNLFYRIENGAAKEWNHGFVLIHGYMDFLLDIQAISTNISMICEKELLKIYEEFPEYKK